MDLTYNVDLNESQDFVFKDWMKLLDKFHQEVDASIDIIHQHKQEIQEMKKEIYDRISEGCYLYDDTRIVISAPEIIIGNVDKSGQLKPGGNKIILRGNQINLEGAGEDGTIQTKATHINQRAIDPGVDGMEGVVHDSARIDMQARSIGIDCNLSSGTYTRNLGENSINGISIHSDGQLKIDASVSHTEWTEGIQHKIEEADAAITPLQTQAAQLKVQLQAQVTDMEELLKQDFALSESDEVTSANMAALDALHLRVTDASIAFFHQIDEFLATLSSLAEQLRHKKALAEAKRTDTAEAFKESATGAHLMLNGERTELNSTDGDRQIHPTENTQITLNSQNITLKSTTEEGGNLENGLITVNAEQISIYTNDTRTDANGNTDSPTTGSLLLNSKQIAITAVDYEQKGEDPITEKCLTDSGNITIRAKDMIIDGTDTEGKAISTTVINSKIVALTTADFDKEKGEYKAITENGQIEMAAPNILIGNSAENWESQLVQIVSNQIVEGAKTSAEILQGQDNTILKLADDKVVLSATKENELYGKKIAVNGESSFSGKMTANSINVKSLDVSGKLKAPNLEAGTGAASGGSSATFSAKVNIQEQKHEKLKYEKGKKSKSKNKQ